MRDIAEGLAAWAAAGRRFALATVVRTWRSAPRQPGAAMAVADDGTVIGSISGGCVEGAVYDLATEVLATGKAQLVTFGVSDDDAFAVGLTCGGTIEVLIVPGPPEIGDVLKRLADGRPVAVAGLTAGGPLGAHLVVTPDEILGSLGDDGLDAGVTEVARGMLAHGTTGTFQLGRHGQRRMVEVDVFVESLAPKPRMLVFGAIDFASAVARMGTFLGYRVTVCDARAVFTTPARFPDVDELVVEWPHRFLAMTEVEDSTVICVLTHDPKFDVPLLEEALRTPARYIGVMGSWRTHEDRMARLREAGVGEESLRRLSSPIGLDLGARTPEETAVAIAAEIVATTWGGTGQRLTDRDHAPIHPG